MYQVEYARNLSLPEIRAEYSACITDAGSILYRLVTGREGNMATNHAVGIKSNRQPANAGSVGSHGHWPLKWCVYVQRSESS